MGETTSQIEWEISQKRSELTDNVIELKERAKAAVDWRAQFEERPGTLLAAAFGGGIVLSALFSALRGPAPARAYATPPARPYAPAAESSAVDYSAPAPGISQSKVASVTRKNLDALGGALLGMVATRATSFLDELLPGFQTEFERAKTQAPPAV